VRFFDFGQHAQGVIAIGQHAQGVIAIGQEAVGVIAIGQLAVGFIAIGQVARGVFVVGQLAIGMVAVGQLTLGVWGGVGMMAIAGRWVKGLGLAIWPKREDDRKLPKPIPLENVKGGQPGFVQVDVEVDGDDVRLVHHGETLEVAMPEGIVSEAYRIGGKGVYPVALVWLEQKEKIERGEDVGYREAAPMALYLEADRIIEVPRPSWQQAGFWAGIAARSVGILGLAAVWVVAVIFPLWNELFATKTTLLPSIFGL